MERVLIPQQQLIDAVVDRNLVPSNYFSGWDFYGDWQLSMLLELGLEPKHKVLDIGCGAMRLGLHLVANLDDGNYYGIDPYTPYIELARNYVRIAGLTKRYHLQNRADLAFEVFGARFDYAVAQSVFTHLSLAQIETCMANLQKVMVAGGKFFFTYIIKGYTTMGFLYDGVHAMEHAWIEDEAQLTALGAKYGARFEALGIRNPYVQRAAVYHY